MVGNELFRRLSVEEATDFRLWARENYVVGDEVRASWHPVTCAECEQMNAECVLNVPCEE